MVRNPGYKRGDSGEKVMSVRKGKKGLKLQHQNVELLNLAVKIEREGQKTRRGRPWQKIRRNKS